jgi:hypothetical protein
MTNYLSPIFCKKMAEQSEAEKREAMLRVTNQTLSHFYAKLRFALFASLRSAIFSEI